MASDLGQPYLQVFWGRHAVMGTGGVWVGVGE